MYQLYASTVNIVRSRRWCYIVLITANAHAAKQASSQAYMPCISVVPELHWLAFCDRFASGLLRDMGLPSTPQQASATYFPVHHTSAFLRRKPVPPCRRSKFTLRQQLPRRGSSFQGGVPQLRSNKQATGALLHFRMGLKRLRNFHTKITPFNSCVILAPGYWKLCCCNEPQQQASAGPGISLLRPELQRQWHHAKNQHLGDKRITASTDLRVWWSCDKCPCGLQHEWLASVSRRQDLDGRCPFCHNNRRCHHNSLLTVAPAVAAYWDTAKNVVTPDQFRASSSTRRHWLCSACGYSWQAMTYGKVRSKSGCPKCSKNHNQSISSQR